MTKFSKETADIPTA